MSRVRGEIASHFAWVDRSASVGGQTGKRDASRQLHCPERPAHAVVFQIGRDDVIAVLQHAFDGHVEGVGPIEREDPPLRTLP